VYGVFWGERFADVNGVNRVPHGGGGVMVWAGISYGQQTQLHFIDANLNSHCRAIYPPPAPHISA
jgi:hypothetical protein